MNFDEIVTFQTPKETYYDILGCDHSSSLEQIVKEYKIKALSLHPDKNTDPKSVDAFKRLQEAKDVLTNPSTRRSYDTWLNSRIHIPFKQWNNRKGHSLHWASPKPKHLSINCAESSRQGSDSIKFEETTHSTPTQLTGTRSMLEKFRSYDI